MKKVLFATGVAVLALASIASAQGYTFSANLTVGSTGSDVVALQTALMSAGYNIPAIASGAAAKGYFGSQTQAAVKLYQAAHGVPNTGFVGPLTRAALNGSAVATGGTTVSTCPAGYVCTPTGGNTTGTTGGVTGGITTPGVPGIMTVTAGPLSSSVLNVGAQMVPVMTIRAQAQYSDVDVQSLTLDLGNNTSFFNKVFNTIYVTDGTNILATQSLNGSTVVQSGSEYILGIAGFHFIVPKGAYKDLVIKASLNSSIDSNYISATGTHYPATGYGGANSINGSAVQGWGIGIVANGLRGVDGAGLNLYGPTTGFNQTFTVNASLVDNALANVSLDSSSPLIASTPVSDTTNGQYLGLPVLVFDVNAQNDTLHLHQVVARISLVGSGSVGAAYLFNGSTQVSSASVSSGVATFTNITDGTNGATIPVNTTVPFTVKVDVTGLTTANTSTVITAGVATSTSADLSIYNSIDGSASISGSALGNAQTVVSSGPMFTLVGTPTIVKSGPVTTGGGSDYHYDYVATFNINVTAVGQSVLVGLPASTTCASAICSGASFGTSTSGLAVAQLYESSSASTTGNLIGISAGVDQPSNTTLTANTFQVSRNQSVPVTVRYTFTIYNGTKTEAVQLQGIYTNGTVLTNFMANQPAWRTNSV
jgi:peptidoglycan hydrolase-like protein with peptidoglycan-binding domain